MKKKTLGILLGILLGLFVLTLIGLAVAFTLLAVRAPAAPSIPTPQPTYTPFPTNTSVPNTPIPTEVPTIVPPTPTASQTPWIITATTAPTQTEEPTQGSPVIESTPTAAPQPLVISDLTDFHRVVMEPDGRIWFDQIKNGHSYFEVSITIPQDDPAGLGWKRVFNGVNGHLWYDSNRDGTPDTLIAELGNNIPVQLVPGGWYKIKCGEFNGTISLELPR